MKVAVHEDFSVISIECLSDRLGEALDTASGIIQSPLLSGMRIDHNKRTMALLGRDREDDASEIGHDAALNAFFQGQGCGGALFGTAASLKVIEKKAVVGYYERYFTKSGLFFSVCTDLDSVAIRAGLEKAFTKFRDGKPDETARRAPVRPESPRVTRTRDSKQTYIARVFALPPVSALDYADGLLLETALGTGPGSRLWNLRVRERLAYNVNVRTTWTKAGGILEAYLETENTKTGQARPALAAVLEDLFKNGLSEDELAATKAMAKSGFLRANEVKQMRAATMGGFESLGLGAGFLSGVFDAIDAVTLSDLNAFIRRILDPSFGVEVIVGPGAGQTP